ncbi:MAG TPA: hypothetical protein VFV05_09850 [Methylomirabilota bacterium]|nr:hypothetical protein [Methylomirabilota bacterium]
MAAATARPQGYTFGWVVACGGLSNLGNPALLEGWGSLLETGGPPLAGMVTVWSVVIGLAAAAVRPWSWYVLLACHGLGLVWTGLYAALVASAWRDVAIVAAIAPVYSLASFAYFYRRRALFGARGRWRLLERWWPWVIGPETPSPGARRGFVGLSLRHRLLFVVVTALLILIGRA